MGFEADGYGKLRWFDGTTYDGQWKQNLPNGNGTMKWPDGRQYSGEFVDGERQGVGNFTDSEGHIFVKSCWLDDEMIEC